MTRPLVSIILPIFNEASFVKEVLQTFNTQDYPSDCMEILIADGMSTDDTRKIIRDFSALHPHLRIRVFDNPAKIVPTGLNIALQQAKGEIIIRVDGHCIIAPDYVSKCVEHLQSGGVDGVGGSIETLGVTRAANAIAIGMSSPFGVGNSGFRTVTGKSMLVDSVPFAAYSRAIIERAGLYDEELVRDQDDEYNYRIRELGGKILLAKDIHSSYYGRKSWMGLWQQYYQYGFWKVRVMQKHPHQMSWRQFVPPIFVASLITSAIILFIPFPSFSIYPSFIIPACYILANLSATIITAAKKGWKYVLLLPFVFSILHLSYGLGFLAGLVKFWNRWKDKVGLIPRFTNEPTG